LQYFQTGHAALLFVHICYSTSADRQELWLEHGEDRPNGNSLRDTTPLDMISKTPMLHRSKGGNID
tara:strand:+ start:50524 stop:50721 length:198 start_codon:yes stop_codon:yes gene_type:complete